MQGMVSTSTVVERPLRRVSSVRAAMTDLQMHLEVKNSTNSAHHSSASSFVQRQDSKFDKPDRLPTPGGAPTPLGGTSRNDTTGKSCDACHSNSGLDSCSCGVVLLPRRLHSTEQAARKTRVLAACCISGVLSLFLFLQIVSGGFGIISYPLKVPTLRQMQSVVSDVQINALREDPYDKSDALVVQYWKALPTPLKQIANKDVSSSTTSGDGQVLHPVQAKSGQGESRHMQRRSRTGQLVTKFQASDTGPPIPVLDEQVGGDGKDLKSWQLPLTVPSEDESGTPSQTSDGVERMRRFTPVDGSATRQKTNRADQYPWAKPLNSGKLKQCIHPAGHFKRATEETNGYILMFANGGLNQMRTGICDMVAVARVLNATLVIPELDHTSYWADPSDFGKVFDVDHFIETLKDDVKVVPFLPHHLLNATVFELAPRSWSEANYYEEEILPILKEHKVVRFVLTDSRLANNRIDREIQRLRCRANYWALTFHPAIRDLAHKIISRLGNKGPFIALHLRYEKDMLAFSGCTFGLRRKEVKELRDIRYNVSRWKEKEIDPVARRADGLCPLTPQEIGLMLKAMDYPSDTIVYVAAGQIYGGERRMKSFASFFPNVVTKETLTTEEELSPFKDYQNRMAALDYLVAVESDVFVPTYDGNMARAVQGHRRFLGHKKTLMPDRVELVKLFDAYHGGELDWLSLRKQVQRTHRSRQGAHHDRKPLSPSRVKQEENFYANPTECFCSSVSPSSSVLQLKSRHP